MWRRPWGKMRRPPRDDGQAALPRHFASLRPGGLLVLAHPPADLARRLAGLVDALNRGCFDDDFVGPLPGVEDKVKVPWS